MQAEDLEIELNRFTTLSEYSDKPSYNGFIGDYSGLDEYKIFLQDLSKTYFEDIAIKINSFIEKGKISHLQKFIDLKIDTFKTIENNFNENFHWGIDNLLKQIQEEIQEYAMSTPMPVLYYAYWSKLAYKNMAKIHIDSIKKTIEQLTSIKEANYPDIKIIAPPNEMLYFTRSFTNEERKKIFNDLIKERFLPQETDYGHFCFVFGGIEVSSEKPFEPLKWQKTIALLAYFVDNMFGDTDPKRLWEITSNCFIRGNDRPNKDSLKNIVSKIRLDFKNKPKGYESIDNIIL